MNHAVTIGNRAFKSIQEAIDAMMADDKIALSPGVYSESAKLGRRGRRTNRTLGRSR